MSESSEERVEADRFVPRQPDMWAFVLFEALVFTGYFLVYVVRRSQNLDLFLSSQAHLDLRVGVFHTLVLLASSWSVARFSFYYFLTALHFLHLLIGFGVLGIAVHQLWSPARRSQQAIETCATYWHTVDFLWVMIFALLYVMR
jgi:nitric oxide reductase NorE protein